MYSGRRVMLKSSNGWKFFALLFGGLLAALVGLYIYKQQIGRAHV